MNKTFSRYAMLSSLVLLFGCQSMRTGTGGTAPTTPNNTSVVTATEWADFAKNMVTAMTQQRVLDRYWKNKGGSEPIVLAMGDWHTRGLAPGLAPVSSLLDPICSILVATGKVVIKDPMGDLAGLSARDNLVRKVRQLRQSADESADEGIDLGISGGIEVTTVPDGPTTRTDYVVTIQLLDVRKKHIVFRKVLILPKSFKRGSFGR